MAGYTSKTFGDGNFQWSDIGSLLGFGESGYSFLDIISGTSPYSFGDMLEADLRGDFYTPALGDVSDPITDVDLSSSNSVMSSANAIKEENDTSAQDSADRANNTTLEWLEKVMRYNSEQAKLAFQRSQNSADTAYQRELELMERAQAYQNDREDNYVSRMMKQFKDNGLNPKLAYSVLSGSYSPSSPMGTASAVSSPSSSVNSASAIRGEVDISTLGHVLSSLVSKSGSMSSAEIGAIGSILGTVIKLLF